MRRILAAALLAMMVCAGALADPAFDARLRSLEEELRCLVCQNQTLADSNAPLAEDLRREVRELAVAGKSDDEIKQYLVARYGDFVLYRPPVKSTTLLLWFGPFVLLVAGGGIWWWMRHHDKQLDPATVEVDHVASGPDQSPISWHPASPDRF